jgi:hypothetical protein
MASHLQLQYWGSYVQFEATWLTDTPGGGFLGEKVPLYIVSKLARVKVVFICTWPFCQASRQKSNQARALQTSTFRIKTWASSTHQHASGFRKAPIASAVSMTSSALAAGPPRRTKRSPSVAQCPLHCHLLPLSVGLFQIPFSFPIFQTPSKPARLRPWPQETTPKPHLHASAAVRTP